MKNYLFSIRRIVFGFFLLFIVFFVRGQGSETITNPITGSPTSSYTSRTWTGDNGQTWSSTDSRSDQTVYGQAILIRNGQIDFGLTAAQKSAGIGSISFKAKTPFGSPDTGTIHILVDGTNKGIVAISNGSTSAITTYTISGINVGSFSTISLKQTTTSSRIAIDDITWTSYAATANDTNSDISGSGLTQPTSVISSLATSAASQVNVFDFNIIDKGSPGDGKATNVTKITITKGASDSNTWSTIIAGAQLKVGATVITPASTTINASSIVFDLSSLPLTFANNSTTKVSLFVYLSTTVTDNTTLQFTVPTASYGFTADGSIGSIFASTVTGAANATTVIVTATKLRFTTQPTDTALNATMASPVVIATDANGNVDTDFTNTINVTSSGTMNSTPKTASPVSGIATFNNIVHTAIGSNLTLNATSGSLASATSSTFNIILQSSASDYFRSKGTGNWGAVGSWESSSDNVNWISATLSPTSSAAFVTVRAGHTITVSASATSKNLTVESGGFLTVNASFSISGTNTVNGTWNQSTSTTVSNSGTLIFAAGSVYNHNSNGGTIPTATWNVTSTCNILGMTSTTPGGLGQAFGIVNWNSTSQSTFAIMGAGGTFNPKGLFTVASTGTNIIELESAGSGATYNFDGGLTVSGGTFAVNYDNSSAANEVSLNINGDLIISGTGILDMHNGNSNATTSGYGSTIYLKGNLEISSSANYPLTATGNNNSGYMFFVGSTPQTYKTTVTAPSRYVDFAVYGPSNLTLLSDMPVFSSATNIYDEFFVSGTLNLGTFAIKQSSGTQARFTTLSGSTVSTSNTGGLVSAIAVAGTKTFAAGTSYTFNASTAAPFPTGTFGNPANLTFNNADVTTNRTTTLTVTGAVNINGTSKFALNSSGTNDLMLGGVMTIGANASFDSNGENQINNGGGSIVVNGTFITKDAQGFSGTNATIPTITNITLNNGSTVQYALDGAQAISSRTDYKNLLFTGNGTKSSNNSITPIAGTVTVSGVNTILDVSNNTFGDSGTSLTMTAGTFRLGGSGVKPDISGTYSLSAGTTIEFTGTSATQIRLAPQYANVVISGTNVVAGTTTNGGLTFRTGGNFKVKNGARFKVNNDNGFSGSSTTAIKNTNSPVITLETGSTIDYTGSDQIVTNILPYQNLNISTIGTKTASSGDLVVNNLTAVSAGTLKFLKTADNATPNVLYAHTGINNVGGSVIFENNAQLMQDDDANNTQATIQSQRDVIDMNNVSTQMDYVYWSSPVDGQNIKAFSPNTPASGYLQYNESNDKFSLTTDANFQNGKGYAIRAETGTNGYNKSYVFTGIPHNSSVDSPNLKWKDASHGYNLIGNPYPSNISFDALFTNNSSKIYSTAWFWTNNSYTAAQLGSGYNGNNYAVYNGSGGSPATYSPTSPYTGSAIPNGIIKVGQAFIVQAKSAGTNLPITFTNTMRTTSGGNFFQKNLVKNRFWLTMTSPNTLVNTILVGYITGASNDFETDFDGELFEVGSDSFYSLLGAKKLAIQGKADVFSADDVVSIGNVYSTDGSYSIKLHDAEGLFDGSQKIYLRDKLLNKYIDMTFEQSYQFTAVKGTDNTRFEIVYKDQSVLGADSAVKSDFIVYKDGNEQVVKSDKKLGRIELFDASGKLIRSYVATSNEFRIDTSTLMNALYIIKVNNSGEIRTKKFIK